MNVRLLAAALIPLAAGSTAVIAAPATSPLSQVADHLRTVDTMTADFVQTDRNGRALSGTLTLKRPGRIRFQYQAGVPLLVVGDGKALTMIDYSVKQVSRWPIADSPLGILLDPSRNLTRFARLLPQNDDRVLLVEAKDPQHPEYGTITIAFARLAGAPAGLMLRGWSVLDAQGNRSTIQLSHQRFNVAVDDRAFRWTDPRPQGPRR